MGKMAVRHTFANLPRDIWYVTVQQFCSFVTVNKEKLLVLLKRSPKNWANGLLPSLAILRRTMALLMDLTCRLLRFLSESMSSRLSKDGSSPYDGGLFCLGWGDTSVSTSLRGMVVAKLVFDFADLALFQSIS